MEPYKKYNNNSEILNILENNKTNPDRKYETIKYPEEINKQIKQIINEVPKEISEEDKKAITQYIENLSDNVLLDLYLKSSDNSIREYALN